MSTTDKTGDEVFDSLTRPDEIAIAEAFGSPVLRLAQQDELALTRGLILIDLRRGGTHAKEARRQAFEMPVVEVLDYFADEPEDLDPTDPDSEPGKDD